MIEQRLLAWWQDELPTSGFNHDGFASGTFAVDGMRQYLELTA